MKIIRGTDCRTTAWKNGGGATTEIAVAPPGASLDDFDWRISTARVGSDGPFSEFAGIDRTLAVVEGDGLALSVGDTAPVVLDGISEPMRFPGDTPTLARLLAGEIVDLNVMTRRGRFAHRLCRIREATRCDFDGHDVALVVACSGRVELGLAQQRVILADRDTAVLTRVDDAPFGVAPAAAAICYLVLLRDLRDHAG